MAEITLETIREAQADPNGSEAASSLISDMEGRCRAIAVREAGKMFSGSSEAAEELFQTAQIAVWECIVRFDGDSVDGWYAFAYRTAQLKVAEESSAQRHQGADKDERSAFGYWIKQTDGDAYLAEKLMVRSPDGVTGHRYGADRAHAARLAWQSSLSLDVGPEVGLRATLTSMLGIPEDLITPADISADERMRRIEMVRAVLDAMNASYANTLRGTYGIEPMALFGADDNEALGAVLGLTAKQVREARSRGKVAFAKRWIMLMPAEQREAWQAGFDEVRQASNASGTRRAEKIGTAA